MRIKSGRVLIITLKSSGDILNSNRK